MNNSKIKRLSAALLVLCTLVVCLSACKYEIPEGLWDDATYTKDTTLGAGAKTVTVLIEVGDKKVELTIKTDADTLGEALYNEGIINDPSFFVSANGITASYNKNHAYWAFYQGDQYRMVGVNETPISTGDSYRLVYTIDK